ncbi:MAG: hypothetical protein CBB71_00665 [Rhodopirellula sp. TMED11]|nr:MAG: hypothetical protein CBB71_00665 [Rhodopirellula sp. TMED11]
MSRLGEPHAWFTGAAKSMIRCVGGVNARLPTAGHRSFKTNQLTQTPCLAASGFVERRKPSLENHHQPGCSRGLGFGYLPFGRQSGLK